MITAMQNTTTIQHYTDINGTEFVMGIPKNVYEDLVQLVGLKDKLQEIREKVTQIFGVKEVKKAEIAKMLNKSPNTIDLWMYGNRAETNPIPLLVEGVHYRKAGARSILYNVENMKKFNPETAKEEILREEARQAQEKIYQIEVKLAKKARNKNK